MRVSMFIISYLLYCCLAAGAMMGLGFGYAAESVEETQIEWDGEQILVGGEPFEPDEDADEIEKTEFEKDLEELFDGRIGEDLDWSLGPLDELSAENVVDNMMAWTLWAANLASEWAWENRDDVEEETAEGALVILILAPPLLWFGRKIWRLLDR